MTSNLQNDFSFTSNEDVVNELTKDLGSVTVNKDANEDTQPENEVLDSKSQNSCEKENTEVGSECSEDDKSDGASLDESYLAELDAIQSEEEKNARKDEALKKKEEGNELFKSGDYSGAEQMYSDGIRVCPLYCHKERAILFCNRAAAKMKLGRGLSAIQDCDQAIELSPDYLRAIVRRATIKEEQSQYDEALKDWNVILEMHPNHKEAIIATQRLPPLIAEKNEKLKEEMIDKLKSLGNMVLRPFGLSTENFKMIPTEEGGYSVQFQQNK